jgi:hypothetical protein
LRVGIVQELESALSGRAEKPIGRTRKTYPSIQPSQCVLPTLGGPPDHGRTHLPAAPTGRLVPFSSWCERRGSEASPASPETLVFYLTELATTVAFPSSAKPMSRQSFLDRGNRCPRRDDERRSCALAPT